MPDAPAFWPAVTVLQPFAHALVVGVKPDENRTWDPSPVALRKGQWIAIHAGKRRYPFSSKASERHVFELWRDARGMDPLPFVGLPTSAVVGACRFAGVRTPEEAANPWAIGPRCWHFDAAFVLRDPFPCNGALGIWKLTDHRVLDALEVGLVVWRAKQGRAA